MLSEEIAEKLHTSKIMEPYNDNIKIVKTHIITDLFHYVEQIINNTKTFKKEWSLLRKNGNHVSYELHYNNGKQEVVISNSKENVLALFILRYSTRTINTNI